MRLSDNARVYPAVFSYADDGISVRFPDLPGCLTCGQTDVEALFMAKDALRCYLAMLQDEGEPIPEPTPMYQLGETEARERITLVCIGDAEPVRLGFWKWGLGFPYCSECKMMAHENGFVGYHTSDYCPNCGAKMDGGKQDANV